MMSDTYPPHPQGQPVPGAVPGQPEYPGDQCQPGAYPQTVQQGYAQPEFAGYQHPAPQGHVQPGYGAVPSYEGGAGYPPAPGYPEEPGYPQGQYSTPYPTEQASAVPPQASRRGVKAVVGLVLVAFLAAGGFFVWKYATGAPSLTPLEHYFPQLVRPSDQWNKGYEVAWEIEGPGSAYAHGDRMVALTYPNHHGMELTGYDISGDGEPRELWKKEIHSYPMSQYWTGKHLIVRGLSEGQYSPQLSHLDVDTGEIQPLKTEGTLHIDPQQYSAYFWKTRYMVCGAPAGAEDIFSGYLPQPGNIEEGCQAFTYEGEELWHFRVSELDDEGLMLINTKTGEITTADTDSIDTNEVFASRPWIVGFDPDYDSYMYWVNSVAERESDVFFWDLNGNFRGKTNVKQPISVVGDVLLGSGPEAESLIHRLGEGDETALDGIATSNREDPEMIMLRMGTEWERRIDRADGQNFLASPGGTVIMKYDALRGVTEQYGGAGIVTGYETLSGEHLPLDAELQANLARPDLLVVSSPRDERFGDRARITAYRPKR